jgi:hypothetical protein
VGLGEGEEDGVAFEIEEVVVFFVCFDKVCNIGDEAVMSFALLGLI